MKKRLLSLALSICMLAARYDGGRLDTVKLFDINEPYKDRPVGTDLPQTSGCTCKLMLVDGTTWAPLCDAWVWNG